jgi:hypothetical protein
MQSTTMYTTPSIFVANPPHPRFLEEEGERGGISTAEPSWGSIVASRHCSISRCSIRIFILWREQSQIKRSKNSWRCIDIHPNLEILCCTSPLALPYTPNLEIKRSIKKRSAWLFPPTLVFTWWILFVVLKRKIVSDDDGGYRTTGSTVPMAGAGPTRHM